MSDTSTSATPRNVPRLLLTVREAATALGLGRSGVYHLIASEELRSVEVGRSRRIPVGAVHHYDAGPTLFAGAA